MIVWLAAWKLVSNVAKRNHTTKCEAFHFAPRLFFMFLFLTPFTIRQHCIIYPQEFSTEPFYPWLRVERMPASRLAVSSVSVAVSMLVESKRSWALL